MMPEFGPIEETVEAVRVALGEGGYTDPVLQERVLNIVRDARAIDERWQASVDQFVQETDTVTLTVTRAQANTILHGLNNVLVGVVRAAQQVAQTPPFLLAMMGQEAPDERELLLSLTSRLDAYEAVKAALTVVPDDASALL